MFKASFELQEVSLQVSVYNKEPYAWESPFAVHRQNPPAERRNTIRA
jgi:hypothetical protein